MFKTLTVIKTALVMSAVLCCSQSAFALRDDMGFSNASRAGAWRFTEDPEYNYAKFSSSNFLSLREAVPHHSLSIRIQQNLIDSFNFRVGCMLQSTTPVFELKVPSLDIRLFDTIKGMVYARFLVDKKHEYSLRGEIIGRNRLVFAPITQAQSHAISDLFLQLREGSTLKIGLLQGETATVKEYTVPLSGFMDYADRLLQSCVSYNQYFKGDLKYLPDYMAKEPEGYAPKDFTLKEEEKQESEFITIEPPRKDPAPEIEPEELPEVLPFRAGRPVSIGPDGRPVGVGGAKGEASDKSLGAAAAGPVAIGPDGKPVKQDQSEEQKSEANDAFEPEPQAGGSDAIDIF